MPAGYKRPWKRLRASAMASKQAADVSKDYVAFNAPATKKKLNEIARKELGETEELRQQCLQQLKDLITRNNVSCITSDDFLLRFLRTKKFDVQRGFTILRNYVDFRVSHHNRLLKLQPETVREVLRHNIFSILPYRDSNERLIYFFRSGIWNPKICSPEELIMIHILLCNYLTEQESSQITGVVLINDCKIIPWGQISILLYHTPVLKKFIVECLPVRTKAIHVLKEPSIMKYVCQILNPFIPEKIRNRMLFHGEATEDLFQHFTPAILPDDFGGCLGPLNNDHLIEIIIDYLQKMKDEQRHFL